MNDNNPYSTPKSDVTKEPESSHSGEDFELAGRGQRLAAAIIDGIISTLITIGVMMPFGMLEQLINGVEPGIPELLIVVVLSFSLFFVLNGYLLHINGQTIGKKLLSIRISNLEGHNPGAAKIIFARYLPIQVIAQIPFIGGLVGLVNVLMIFGSERRCLHDYIAGTIVVNAA